MENIVERDIDQQLPVRFYIDVTPLLDDNWTGIPVVAANLSRQFLKNFPESVRFFFEDSEVSLPYVLDALERDTGYYLHRDFFSGDANSGLLESRKSEAFTVGIHPSVKRRRSMFDVECSVVHDLSTLITPEFHVVENIRNHTESLQLDLDSNDVTFCVSEACRKDLEFYLGKKHVKLVYNGVSWPEIFDIRYKNEYSRSDIEPYVFILGTREPRKNLSKLFEMLDIFPEATDGLRFVISGRAGWLQDQTIMTPTVQKLVETQRIILPGFISEYQKYCFLRNAQFTIYPSLFEGFGLPVLESMSLGTPCLSSISSSLPEVGGASAVYFDPVSVVDMYEKFSLMKDRTPDEKARMSENAREQSRQFTWENSYDTVIKNIGAVLDQRGVSLKNGTRRDIAEPRQRAG